MTKLSPERHAAEMEKVKTAVIAVLLIGVHASFAQTVIPELPSVPTVGVSPALQWMMGVCLAIISAVLPIAVAFLKQRINTANAADHSAIIDRSTDHAALVSYGNQIAGASPSQAAADALAYVKSSNAQDSVEKTNTTDAHLADVIAAKVVGLNKTPMPAAIDTAIPSIPTIPPIPLRGL